MVNKRMSESARERESESAMERDRDFPEGWVWTTIGEVAETTSGGTPSREHPEYYKGSVPWVKSGELEDSKVTAVEEFITEEALDHSNAKIFPRGTPLVALYGATIGQTGILGIEAATNQAICAIFPQNDAFTPAFVIYWLQYQRPQLIESGAGGAQPNISQQIIRSFHFPLPPLPEQRRIVEAIETQFTRMDAAVAALERARANLERYRASVLQAACEGQLVPTEAEMAREEDRDYEPADALLERILAERRAKWEEERWEYEIERAKKKAAQAERKAAGLPYYIRELPRESWIDRTEEEYEPYLPKGDEWKEKYDEPDPPDTEDLPDLSEGWCWMSLDQAITLSQNGFGKRRADEGEPTIVLRLADIEEGRRISLDDVRRIRMSTEEIEKYRLLEDDLLCIRVNGSPDLVGRIIPFENSSEPIAFCDHFIRLRFAMPELTSFFVQYSGTRRARRYIDLNKVSSAGQNTISQTTMESLVFPLPPLTEQRRIVEEVERRLSVVDALEQTVEANLTRAERLRQAILKKAFEGRLVDQDPNDEPALALLERIKSQK
jgi:type I restriction enzyme S subunit